LFTEGKGNSWIFFTISAVSSCCRGKIDVDMVVKITRTVIRTFEDSTESRLRFRSAPIYSVGLCGNKMMQVVNRVNFQ